MRKQLLIILVCGFFCHAYGQSISDFTSHSAEVQRQLEQKFLSFPKGVNNEVYLLHLTEEPPIAGSAESRAVSEYINSKYME